MQTKKSKKTRTPEQQLFQGTQPPRLEKMTDEELDRFIATVNQIGKREYE